MLPLYESQPWPIHWPGSQYWPLSWLGPVDPSGQADCQVSLVGLFMTFCAKEQASAMPMNGNVIRVSCSCRHILFIQLSTVSA